MASLIHDDVLDEADTRRGGKAVHTMYTNKVAVLAGDYLLARASVLLARLQHFQVVEVMASALDALVQGEIMQARSKKEDLLDINYYLRKSYFKTASLICSSCKCTALLAGFGEADPITVAAEEYGYHMGMAFQIVDDILGFYWCFCNAWQARTSRHGIGDLDCTGALRQRGGGGNPSSHHAAIQERRRHPEGGRAFTKHRLYQ